VTIEEFDERVPVHRVVGIICPCGEPAQDVEDHVCGECVEHCRLDRYRRAEEQRRLAEQVRADEQLQRIRSRNVGIAA
jgi:hypothetical protein